VRIVTDTKKTFRLRRRIVDDEHVDCGFTRQMIERDFPPTAVTELVQKITEAQKKIEHCGQQYECANAELKEAKAELGKLLNEAKARCTTGGYKAFLAKFFPNLKKSAAYVNLAILTGKVSRAEVKERDRQRQAKRRNKKKQQTEPFRDVTEKSEAETPSKATAPPLKVVDTALIEFNSLVGRLLQITDREPGRFAKTEYPADALAKLGTFFTELAKLKQSPAAVGLKEVA
jgi:hypothetical protein